MIPIIDISSKTVVPDIGISCRDIGSFYISNHGVDANFLDYFQRLIKMYFDLPLEEKMQLHISRSVAHRGYFPIGEETPKGSTIADLKEGFDMALDLPPTDPDVMAGVPFHGSNVYPSAPVEFADVMDEYYSKMRSLCERLSVIFAHALDLEPDFFLNQVTKPLAQLRILHYPPQISYPESITSESIGCGAHTDYGIVTVLWQNMVGGLEIMHPDGRWEAVHPKDGTLFCNLGDMMERWTNGFWKATPHRVINLTGEERYSAAFFFDPNYYSVVTPLEKFVSDSTPPLYQPVTMGNYLRDGFDNTFKYRGVI